jgi:hypothetical protein
MPVPLSSTARPPFGDACGGVSAETRSQTLGGIRYAAHSMRCAGTGLSTVADVSPGAAGLLEVV